ncbi:1-acyl-sn-glycerol-3-phosphate acyltransferase [Natronospirillum operosum]|uniref:1-acyl-sn-glycerol-3-phosphate acyltransferase n=1 Tax=Natronospirillum operosum TaxID=2759953 RepID=A0A4Z0W6Y6_9GAMM|nr:lysophospholipid acyltransferase family protein [Natronospirillum operosum]TGG92109.1 1-acyl-sn-glycerol-3-phosphate acyltransferase [Natronospirillum operosum]
MILLRRLVRFVIFAVLVVLGLLLTLGLWLPRRLGISSMDTTLKVAAWWYRRLLGTMNAHVHVVGSIEPRKGMWICNHISWLDIVVIGSQAPVHFVSKAEVRRWPVIGFLAAQAGTLFIRRGGGESSQLAQAMSERMREGHGVIFFPEGTTGPGHYLRRFHPRLFSTAIALEQPVIPLAIRYDHEPQPHPSVPYTDGQTLLGNLWQLLGEKRLDITLFAPEPITRIGSQRRELAEYSREVIRESLGLEAPALPPESVQSRRKASS